MLLSAFDNGTWQHALLDCGGKAGGRRGHRQSDGQTTACPRTYRDPAVRGAKNSLPEVFIRAFGRIEKNPVVTLPERHLVAIIPVHAIPKGATGTKSVG